VMPTISGIAGIQTPEHIDGISFLPTLTGKGKQLQHESLYWEFHELKGRQAIRMGDWKLVRYNVLTPDKTTTELFDLKTDIGEEKNIASQNPELVRKMVDIFYFNAIRSCDDFSIC